MTDTKKSITMTKSLIILISGKAGVGKTTFAKNLLKIFADDYDLNCGIFPFATGVKRIAGLMGWRGIKDSRGRSLLQGIGSVGRAYDEDIWVRDTIEGTIEAQEKYPFDVVLVDDWRFPNEAEYIKKNSPLYQVITIRIESPSREILKDTKEYLDASETSLPSAVSEMYDYLIYNVSTLEDLYEDTVVVWESILDKYKENIIWK